MGRFDGPMSHQNSMTHNPNSCCYVEDPNTGQECTAEATVSTSNFTEYIFNNLTLI